ncbi:50S ribosomal protein L7/L12 [Candidatus Roizmanbacteria bacterium]|nr:50S ribosomal protein L7/L12 [Candidatus Roizmanbacteria bacterium]
MADDVKLTQKVGKIAKEIEAMSVVEVAELAKYLQDKFGVSAPPAAAQAAPQATAGQPVPQEAPSEEKSIFAVVLAASGDNKLGVIKAVRELVPTLGLMEAKKIVESPPQEILKDVKKEQADEAKKKLEEVGGKVELK